MGPLPKLGLGLGALAAVLLARASFASSSRTWPVVPNRGILSPFGAPRYTSGNRNHAGVDVAALAGDKVVAIADGEVLGLVSGYQLGAGLQAVAVRHPDADYVYAEIEVVAGPGQRVKAGDVLGVVRKNSDGNQMLHLEAWQSGMAPNSFTPWYMGKPRPAGLLNAEEMIAPLRASGARP
jgi:murein DD-endopeptidase MepM/ murein hydrolase activator NlpD